MDHGSADRRIARHAEPAVAAVEALALLGTLFVLSFSMTYVALSASDQASFSQPVDKVAAIRPHRSPLG
jgi:hypothetical protein